MFVKLDHFCDIIPVWPADQGSVPVGLIPSKKNDFDKGNHLGIDF